MEAIGSLMMNYFDGTPRWDKKNGSGRARRWRRFSGKSKARTTEVTTRRLSNVRLVSKICDEEESAKIVNTNCGTRANGVWVIIITVATLRLSSLLEKYLYIKSKKHQHSSIGTNHSFPGFCYRYQ